MKHSLTGSKHNSQLGNHLERITGITFWIGCVSSYVMTGKKNADINLCCSKWVMPDISQVASHRITVMNVDWISLYVFELLSWIS